jgi:hypothetical protein
MREDLTRRTMQCQNPDCRAYFVPLDDEGYCECCSAPVEIPELDLGDCEDEP